MQRVKCIAQAAGKPGEHAPRDVLDRLAALVQLTPDELERARGQVKGARGLDRNKALTVKVDLGRDELDPRGATPDRKVHDAVSCKRWTRRSAQRAA